MIKTPWNLLQQSIATDMCSISREGLNASNTLINIEVAAETHLITSTIHFFIQDVYRNER